jgi:hypothetical protein
MTLLANHPERDDIAAQLRKNIVLRRLAPAALRGGGRIESR